MQTDVEFSVRALSSIHCSLTESSVTGVYHLSWDITSLEFDVLVLCLKKCSCMSLFTPLYSLADIDFCIPTGIDTVFYSLTSK